MKTTYKLLGVALAAVLLLSGVAVATGGIGAAAQTATFADTDEETGNWSGPGEGWHWADDDRVDRFQERFNLTDDEVAEIRETVQSMIDDGAPRGEIHETVTEMLEEFGVDDPELGPVADRDRGAFGPNETAERAGPGERGGPGDAGERGGPGDAGERGGHGYGPGHGWGDWHDDRGDRWDDRSDDRGDRGDRGTGPHGPGGGSCR